MEVDLSQCFTRVRDFSKKTTAKVSSNNRWSFSYTGDDFGAINCKWLGLDKYKKFLLGIRIYDERSPMSFELYKLSLFTGKSALMKRYTLRDYVPPWDDNDDDTVLFPYASLSKNGEFINILVVWRKLDFEDDNWEQEESLVKFIFCLIDVENAASFQVYKFIDQNNVLYDMDFETEFENSLNTDNVLVHDIGDNEWVLRFFQLEYDGSLSYHFYRMTIDDVDRRSMLTFATVYRNCDNDSGVEWYRYEEVFVDRQLFLIRQSSQVTVNCFDFSTNQWFNNVSLKDPLGSHVDLNGVRAITTSGDRENLLVLINEQQLFIANCDTTTHVWCKIPVNNLSYDSETSFCAVFSNSSMLVFVLYRNPSAYLHVTNVGSDVLSLKDLCFRQLCNTYENVLQTSTEKQILTHHPVFSMMPWRLKRWYFGPACRKF